MRPKKGSNELKLTRLYDAPVKLVWDAWTDPKKAAKWWGPRGFSITTHSKDLRPGGQWNYTMHGPDGVDYPNMTTYYEVEKYAKLVYDHGANENQPPLFRVTVLFTEVKGKTKMDMTMTLSSPEAAEQIAKFIKAAGGNSTWDRLAEYLSEEETGKDKFVINRSFPVSRNKLFEMWTKPEHFSKWLPPTGFNMHFIRPEIKIGGTSFFSMSDGGAHTMYGQMKYLEITPPEKIVYSQHFTDKNEKPSRHIFAPTWPEAMLTTVLFSEEGPEDTRITVTFEILGQATEIEKETFRKGRPDMTLGWNGSFDQLESLLL